MKDEGVEMERLCSYGAAAIVAAWDGWQRMVGFGWKIMGSWWWLWRVCCRNDGGERPGRRILYGVFVCGHPLCRCPSVTSFQASAWAFGRIICLRRLQTKRYKRLAKCEQEVMPCWALWSLPRWQPWCGLGSSTNHLPHRKWHLSSRKLDLTDLVKWNRNSFSEDQRRR